MLACRLVLVQSTSQTHCSLDERSRRRSSRLPMEPGGWRCRALRSCAQRLPCIRRHFCAGGLYSPSCSTLERGRMQSNRGAIAVRKRKERFNGEKKKQLWVMLDGLVRTKMINVTAIMRTVQREKPAWEATITYAAPECTRSASSTRNSHPRSSIKSQ